MGLFKSIGNLVKDTVDIVKAPVEIAVDVTRGMTKEVAKAANEVVADVKEMTEANEERKDD